MLVTDSLCCPCLECRPGWNNRLFNLLILIITCLSVQKYYDAMLDCTIALTRPPTAPAPVVVSTVIISDQFRVLVNNARAHCIIHCLLHTVCIRYIRVVTSLFCFTSLTKTFQDGSGTRNLQTRPVLIKYFNIKSLTRNVESEPPVTTNTEPLKSGNQLV